MCSSYPLSKNIKKIEKLIISLGFNFKHHGV
jgi:hypothetical protein